MVRYFRAKALHDNIESAVATDLAYHWFPSSVERSVKAKPFSSGRLRLMQQFTFADDRGIKTPVVAALTLKGASQP